MISRTAAANATAVIAKAAPVRINSVTARQRKATAPVLYLQLINKTAGVIGTDAPSMVIPITAGRAGLQSVNNKVDCSGTNGGVMFDAGLTYAVTTNINGLTAPTAGDEPEIIIDFEPYT